MLKQYKNPHPTREPGSNKIVPDEEFQSNLKGYHPELQYSQLQPRNIDPDTIVRKSEGELMRTFQAKSLLSAALDQLAVDQLRREEGEENGMRIRQIATDTHLPFGLVAHHVHQHAAASAHAGLVGSLHSHVDAHHAGIVHEAHAATLADLAGQASHVSRTESVREAIAGLAGHQPISMDEALRRATVSDAGTDRQRVIDSDAGSVGGHSNASTQRNHAGGSSMRVVGTARGDPDDPLRMVAFPSGTDRPGTLPEPPIEPHLPSQDVGRPAAAVDPPVRPVVETREMVPFLSDEQARQEMIQRYDQAAARGEITLLNPTLRDQFVAYVKSWSRTSQELSGPLHGAWQVSIPAIIGALGPVAVLYNPMVMTWFGFGAGNAMWRSQQDTTTINQVIQAAMVGTAASRVAVGGALGAGQLAVNAAQTAANTVLGAGNLAVDAGTLGVNAVLGAAHAASRARHRTHNQGQISYTDPAAQVAGGQGYNVADPSAPGEPARGSIPASQYQEFVRQATEDRDAAVREAYIQGGLAMNRRGAQPAVQEIRETEAQGSASLPQRPAEFPLTNATVGSTPGGASSGDPMPTTQAPEVTQAQVTARERQQRERARQSLAQGQGFFVDRRSPDEM